MNEPTAQMPQPPETVRPAQPPYDYPQPAATAYAAAPAKGPSRAASVSDSRRKSPFLACVLSAMPGLGQVYVGYYQRGFIHAIVAAVAITLLATGEMGPLIPLLGVSLAFFWLYNVVDAGRRAALYNYALDGGTPIELPDDFQFGSLRGSIAGGLTLVVIGLVLLANTRFDMSLAWIEDWWPAAIVAFGAYLVYRAIGEKTAGGED